MRFINVGGGCIAGRDDHSGLQHRAALHGMARQHRRACLGVAALGERLPPTFTTARMPLAAAALHSTAHSAEQKARLCIAALGECLPLVVQHGAHDIRGQRVCESMRHLRGQLDQLSGSV